MWFLILIIVKNYILDITQFVAPNVWCMCGNYLKINIILNRSGKFISRFDYIFKWGKLIEANVSEFSKRKFSVIYICENCIHFVSDVTVSPMVNTRELLGLHVNDNLSKHVHLYRVCDLGKLLESEFVHVTLSSERMKNNT